jgi:signal transduction histidine kinase
MSEPIPAGLLAGLELVVLERLSEGSFRVLGDSPAWFTRLHPSAASVSDGFRPGEQFPFLETFLPEAEDFWRGRHPGRLRSGPWSERSPSGQEYHLEATAMCSGDAQWLLIASLGERYEERRSLLQKARENLLAHDRLTKEIQKKEVLLHCIVHDLSGPLMGINSCFSILDPARLSEQEKEFLEIGQRQAQKLGKLIEEILDAFAAEVAALEAFTQDPAQAPDAAACASEVVQALSPAFAHHHVTLRLAPGLDPARDWKVVGERSRLERVVSNLTENALRHSPPGSVVTISLADEGGHVLTAIDDQGPGIPAEVAATLFQKFAQGKGGRKTGKIGLGLYFCRITVEHWGGRIGYAARPEGGSRFWFRLPKPGAREVAP